MPHVDLGLTAEHCEELGVKTALFIDVWGIGSLSDAVLFSSEKLNAIINAGNQTERVRLPKADKILGGTAQTAVFHPSLKQNAGDESIEIEEMLIAGLHAHTGEANIIAAQY
jgi:hypothetical protein